MDSSKILVLLALLITCLSVQSASANLKLFREYIGADDKGVKLSDIPMNSEVEVHFILSFAIDYTNSSFSPSPTDGNFKVYWDTENLSPSQVSSIKARHPNVKVVISLGGDTIANNKKVYFQPASVKSWVRNAINSITEIVKEYDLDGIDIDYENFHVDADADIFAECIGELLLHLKQNRVISFASIAPFDDSNVQLHYSTLWKKYSHLIDYVNFQFYAYDKGTTVPQFMEYFETQSSNYKGGKVLVSLGTDGSGGLSPEKGFFDACNRLKQMNKLYGIFIWSADDSKKAGFPYEKESLNLLASMN